VLTLSAMWAMIFDWLNGVAIEFYFLLSVNAVWHRLSGRRLRTIAVLLRERKRKREKTPAKSAFFACAGSRGAD